jgi:hypothetical protein
MTTTTTDPDEGLTGIEAALRSLRTSAPPAARRPSTGPGSSRTCPSCIAPPSCFGMSTVCPTRR